MDGFEETYLPTPPEFDHAPDWARALWLQSRKDQHRMARELTLLQADMRAVHSQLGAEPDSEGHGGKGLIGDVRALMALRAQGVGFLAALGLTGALLLYGLVHWIQTIAGKTPAPAAH